MKSFFLMDEEKRKKMEELGVERKLPQKLAELFPIGCAYYNVPTGANEPEDLELLLANEEFFLTIGYNRENFAKRENQLFNVLMGDNQELKEGLREAIHNPDVNQFEQLTTMDEGGNYHHISCRFCHLSIGGAEGILCVEIFGIERLFYTSPGIYEQLLRQADRLNRRWYLIKGQPGAIAILDLHNDSRIVDMNDGMITELGLSWDEFRDNHYGMEIPVYEEDKEKFQKYLKESATSDVRTNPVEVRLVNRSGETHWYEIGIMSYNAPQVGDHYAMMAVWNINRLKETEENLRLQMEQHNLLKDIYDEHIVEYDFINKVCKVPNEFILRKGLDYENCAIPVQDLKDMIHPDDLQSAMTLVLQDKGRVSDAGIFEYRINMATVGKAPEYEWFRIFYKKVYGADGRCKCILGRMISIQRDKERASAMEQRMRIDPMTLLLNKATVEEEMTSFFASNPSGTHAVLMIDVDNFKSVNDNFGHLYGDAVLKSIAETIRKEFRDTDFVGRVGGDEFVVCMKDTQAELALAVANDICNATRKVMQTQDKEIIVSCSIGISMYPESGREYEVLFKKAEHAMYVSKHDGKNTVRYLEKWEPEMDEEHSTYYAQRGHGFERTIQTDRDFLRMSMELLADCKDLKAGMDLLLERVAERYSLNAVSVLRYENERTHVERTNHWTRENGTEPMANRIIPKADVKRFLNKFDENGRYSVNDVSKADNIEYRERQILEGNGIKAFVYAEYDQSVSAQGCLMFQSDMPRRWSDGEKYFFSEFAKIYAVFIVVRDKLVEDSQEITRLKNRDHLTGLMTEEAFSKAVAQRISNGKEGETYYIISSDIMGFAYVNENFGIEAGNQVLIELARMLKAESEDFFVCRQFSDFYAGFMVNTSREKVEAFATKTENRFARMAQKHYPVGGLRLCLGIYEWKNPEEVSLSSALESANIARKASKSMGAGLVVYYDENMRKLKNEQRRVMANFNQSMEEGKFLTYLQPKFDLCTKEIVGAEALARWEYDGRVHAPGEFIEALESIGYIMELDFYIFEQSLKTLQCWKKEGTKLIPISANFSKKHFDVDGIATKIIELTRAYEVSPEYVVIELTESAVEKHTEKILEEISTLRKHGFTVSIDDFGTGYSSLNMLLHIPVDEVKVDKSFLDFYDEDDEHAEKHKKFMKVLAELLSISNDQIICEGVETEEQAEFLVSCGYSTGQGYLLDSPIPVKDFEVKYCKKN